jgi:excinuclease ABC subunit B
VRPLKNQIDDLMEEIRVVAGAGDRVLVTTLTKRSAEDLTDYLRETGVRVEYMHSDIDALERVAILGRLRKGEFDVLVGINLLREGLDFPEVALVVILDADKEGFLRSTTSLVQTAGRCARHVKGRVILYADRETDAIRETIDITCRHREKQIAYNREHGITPKSVKRKINETVYVYNSGKPSHVRTPLPPLAAGTVDQAVLDDLRREMTEAADALEFERAAYLRDQIKELERKAKGRK